MNKRVLCPALLGLLAFSVPAFAEICTIDDVPAATLLLPYFEVDLDNPRGITTQFSVNTSTAEPALVHVVVWSDLSVPVLDFNIYLTGYDVQTVNMRDVLAGRLPQTASAGQNLGGTISPQGAFSQGVNFASCNGVLPPPLLPANFVNHLRLSLTGKASPLLSPPCAGRALGDNIARGYVTMDTVNSCTLRFVGDLGYLSTEIAFANVLWGDYIYADPANDFAQGETLVHVEACPNPSVGNGAGFCPFPGNDYTFYGRYETPEFVPAVDQREPLSQTFATRYLNGGAFTGGTSLVVWRDSKVDQREFTCPAVAGLRPSWYPLGQNAIVIFDEEENPDVPTTLPVSPQPPGTSLIPFPAEAQRTKVGGPNLPVPFTFGWLYLNLGHTIVGDVFPAVAQNWVTTVMDATGLFSVGFDAIQFDSACVPTFAVPGDP